MKIKSQLFLFLACFAFVGVSAQSSDSDGDSSDVNCGRTLSLYAQNAKVKNYDKAQSGYEKLVENCPDESKAIYQYGKRMFKQFIKDSDDDADKKKYAKKLIENYENRLKYFPDETKKGKMHRRIAQLKYDHNIGDKEEQYEAFDKAWKEEKFKDPKALYTYFSLAIDLQDDDKMDLSEAFQKYDNVMDQINTEEAKRADVEQDLTVKRDSLDKELNDDEKKKLKKSESYLTNYMKVKESIDSKIGSRADCDKLVPLYEDKFADNKEDKDWLSMAAKRLAAKECTDQDIYNDISEALYDLDPNAKSARYLGQLAAEENNTSKAVKYYKESIDLEDDEMEKAKVYYLLGQIYKDSGNKPKSRQAYRKAISHNSSMGRAYLKIADLYASSANDCGDDTFQKQSVYWLAAKSAERAGAVDPSIQSNAQSAVKSYEGRAPSKSDVFKKGKEGGTIHIKCWINEDVQVPSL